jgi:hypothetical protein
MVKINECTGKKLQTTLRSNFRQLPTENIHTLGTWGPYRNLSANPPRDRILRFVTTVVVLDDEEFYPQQVSEAAKSTK